MPTYKVTETLGQQSEVRIVKAPNAAQAIRHVAKKSISATPLSVDDALALAGKCTVEEAVAE